jgi:hypothetical protein
MDVLEKFLHSIAYKFPKGYPDMKNDQDILLLENELKKLDLPIQLSEEVPNKPKTIQAVKYIIDKVGNKYNLFYASYNYVSIASSVHGTVCVLYLKHFSSKPYTLFTTSDDLGAL